MTKSKIEEPADLLTPAEQKAADRAEAAAARHAEAQAKQDKITAEAHEAGLARAAAAKAKREARGYFR